MLGGGTLVKYRAPGRRHLRRLRRRPVLDPIPIPATEGIRFALAHEKERPFRWLSLHLLIHH
jgi:hypothetical protein